MKIITDADDQVLLENTPTQAESLPHSLEQAARGIGFQIKQSSYVLINIAPSPHKMASL